MRPPSRHRSRCDGTLPRRAFLRLGLAGLGGLSLPSLWSRSMSVLVAGGGLRMGQVIGATDARGEEPKERPLTPNDLLATWYRYLGAPLATQFQDRAGRPVAILPSGEPIRELL